jgi:hypothetical protein
MRWQVLQSPRARTLRAFGLGKLQHLFESMNFRHARMVGDGGLTACMLMTVP